MRDGESTVYSFLGPTGTFSELALTQVAAAIGKRWLPVRNIEEAFESVLGGTATATMLAIENTVEGGVAGVLDALAATPGLRIIGEYVVPVHFAFVATAGVRVADIDVVAAHPVAYSQCRRWLTANLPHALHLPAASNMQGVEQLTVNQGAIVPLHMVERLGLQVLGLDIGDDLTAVTRFVLVASAGEGGSTEPTGQDKTTLVADLPSNRSGALLELLEQFAVRGVNLSLIHSRPVGSGLGSYRFFIDLEGHVGEPRVTEALMGVKRMSPRVVFLGSYPSLDSPKAEVGADNTGAAYDAAASWLKNIR